MASLLQRGKTYYASFYDSERSPKEKRISTGTKDKTTARRILSTWERAWLTGEADPWKDDMRALLKPEGSGESVSLSDSFSRFLESRRRINCTENTLRTYKETRGGLLKHADGSASVRRLTSAQIGAYVLSESVAPRTRQKRYTHVRAFVRYCMEEELIENSPLARVAKPKADRKLPTAATAEDIAAVAVEIKKTYRKLRRMGCIRKRDMLWKINAFCLSFATGLRRSEIAGLRWGDVCLEERCITLRKQKSREETRLPISDKAAALLRRMEPGPARQFVVRSPGFTDAERNQRSFGNNLSKTWRKYRRKAGVSEDKDFHSLRAGYVSTLSKNAPAAIVQKAARHKSYETTRRYIALHDDEIRGALNASF